MNLIKSFFMTICIIALSACGGGGSSSPTSSGSVTTPSPTPVPVTDYTCNTSSEASNAPHTLAVVKEYPPAPTTFTTDFERWSLTIDGAQHALNVAISKPPIGTPIRGVVIVGHGNSPTQATLPPSAMVSNYWDGQMTTRGYISVTVARRGNFGSTGDALLNDTALIAQYQAHQITYADYALATTRYQSASLVSALDKMAGDDRFKPSLSAILLIGASGGADTVLQTAVDSQVFKSAQNKALIRLTGLDSQFDTNPDALTGVSEYSARQAKSSVSSLWIVGQDDPITKPGQVACQFKFFNAASGFANSFYIVPGLGHFGFSDLFTPTLSPIFIQYMAGRGFAGF